MKTPELLFRPSSCRLIASRLLLGLALASSLSTNLFAQGEIGSGTLTSSGSGPYIYNLIFGNAAGATSPIGSVWYAWVPGNFYLPSAPTSASAPAGWTANISGNSVQFVASSPANDIAPGGSLSGFSYQATFSPTQLAAAPNSGRSVAYSGGLFSDGGNTFTVQAVPEPACTGLFLAGMLALAFRHRFSSTK